MHQAETVVQGYNKMAPFASKSQMYTQTTLNMIHELFKQVGAIRKGLVKLINHLVDWNDHTADAHLSFYA